MKRLFITSLITGMAAFTAMSADFNRETALQELESLEVTEVTLTTTGGLESVLSDISDPEALKIICENGATLNSNDFYTLRLNFRSSLKFIDLSAAAFQGGYIGEEALNSMVNIVKVILPETGLNGIEQRAFQYCVNLVDINLPNSLTYLNDKAFYNCKNLTLTELPPSLKTISNQAFCADNIATTVNGTSYTGDTMPYVTISELPESVTKIGDQAFNNTNVSFSSLPDGVAEIGKQAFRNSKVTISAFPASLSDDWSKLKEAVFVNCPGVTEFTIPENMTEIPNQTFYLDKSITTPRTFTFLCATPPTAAYDTSGYTGAFGNHSSFGHITIYVPDGSVDSYKNTSPYNTMIVKAISEKEDSGSQGGENGKEDGDDDDDDEDDDDDNGDKKDDENKEDNPGGGGGDNNGQTGQDQPPLEADKPLTFMLYGASFAIPQNGWFEIACENMNAEGINKAVSGEAIYNDARRMYKGTNYTTEELDKVDILVISHVHNQNVANEANLKTNPEDYTNIESTTDYAVAYDYVIKKYMADCAALENDPASAYYNVTGGKPARIMLTTHWHDSRVTYNTAIRTLAEKWNLPLVEFDTNIGFSKDDDTSDPGAASRAMAHDDETIGAVKYGWHPLRGVNSPIQRRMAAIFTKAVEEAYDLSFPFEMNVTPVSPVYIEGEEVRLSVEFRNGMFPYSLSGDYTATGLEGKRNVITKGKLIENTTYSLSASDSSVATKSAESSSLTDCSAEVLVADYYALPDYDSFVNQLNQSTNYDSNEELQLKISYNAQRKAYISFQASEDMPRDADKVVLRLYYKGQTLGYFNDESGRPQEGIEVIGVEGNTNVYSSNQINWSTSASHSFESIDSYMEITSDMLDGWVGIDVTDWAKKTLASLEDTHTDQNIGHLTFRLFVADNNSNALMNFYSTEGDSEKSPQLLFATKSVDPSSIEKVESGVKVSFNRVINPLNEEVRIYGIDGMVRYSGTDSEISLESLGKGIFIVKAGAETLKLRR